MDLVFLHGASAVGKLTVAKALLEMLPARLFDNHSAIDLALTVFDFGTPGFWRLVDEIRVTTLDIAAAHDVGLIVTTFCYADPGDRRTLERFEQILERHRYTDSGQSLAHNRALLVLEKQSRAEHGFGERFYE